MTNDALQVARLDRSKPPPEYGVGRSPWVQWSRLTAAGHAVAWAHYQERNDPPGVLVTGRDDLRSAAWFSDDGPCHAIGFTSKSEARAAAWAWYWNRANLSRRLGLEHHWPAILTWSDEQVAEVAAYCDALPNGDPFTIEMPAVLRG